MIGLLVTLVVLHLLVWMGTLGLVVTVYRQEMRAQREAWAAAVGEKKSSVESQAIGHVSGPRSVKARLLDPDERVVEHELNIPADQRRPGLRVNGVRYQAVRLAGDGVWEYRRTA